MPMLHEFPESKKRQEKISAKMAVDMKVKVKIKICKACGNAFYPGKEFDPKICFDCYCGAYDIILDFYESHLFGEKK